jgi:hypothetical protein
MPAMAGSINSGPSYKRQFSKNNLKTEFHRRSQQPAAAKISWGWRHERREPAKEARVTKT